MLIPDSKIMSGKSIHGANIESLALKLHDQEQIALNLCMMQEMKDPESKFKPYLDILPTNFDNFPVRFTKDEMELL